MLAERRVDLRDGDPPRERADHVLGDELVTRVTQVSCQRLRGQRGVVMDVAPSTVTPDLERDLRGGNRPQVVGDRAVEAAAEQQVMSLVELDDDQPREMRGRQDAAER